MADPNTHATLARCYRHPKRETGVRCVRCDRPICPDCMRPASVGFMCPDDVKAGNATVRRPRTVVGAVVGSGAPVVSYTLIALNVAVYLLTSITGRGLNAPGGGLFASWVLVPQLVADGQYYRLLTNAFLHLSLLHIGANMLALYLVGPAVERALGAWRYLALYLLSLLGGATAIMLFGNPLGAVAGASGAIFGLFAAALVLARRLGLDPRWLMITIVINVVITVTVPGISVAGHIGGFVVGGLVAVAFGGVPGRSTRPLPLPLQAAGLAGVLVILVAALVVRLASYPTLG